MRWLGRSAIRERVRLVTLQDAKDVSELYLADTEAFADRLEAALMAATPWGEHERIAARVRSGEAWKACGQLAKEQRILDVFAEDLAGPG